MIAFVWAQDQAGTIGKNGKLPWHLPDDLHQFKQLTLGQLTVMGRTTYEGLPKRPLPGRTNIVLTRQADYQAPGAVVIHDRKALLAFASAHPKQHLMIVGGAQIFTAYADIVDRLYVTKLAGTFTGDVKMPALDWAAFKQVASREVIDPDPRKTHVFETWQRKS
ncbi:dihydrofolate reductase [Lacticaseibacillus sp. 53-4]|uniref:dihydrofolate reductase n=1 Tax=Lacticaseibacillus sp. 53-4 TaxID=2799575 RepID=UPI0019434974|nr:dihydrofolate reductase [Lacticaseibacillus sp. 53-4]